MKIEFDKVTCSRCAGAGYFRAWSHIKSGVCFRCGGAGTTLTKKGAAAQSIFRQAMTITADALEPGMVVIEPDVSPDGEMILTRKVTVESVGTSDTKVIADGVPVEYLAVTYKGGRVHHMAHATKIQQALSALTRDTARAALEGVVGATVID